MNCVWVQERLLLYLAGELGPSQTPRLIRHLEHCRACTAMAESLSEMGARVEAALPAAMEAPARLDERVMAAVRDLPAPRRSRPALLPRRRVLHRLALGGALLGLMAASFCAGHWQAAVTLTRRAAPAAPLDLALLGAAHQQSLTVPRQWQVATDSPVQLSRALSAVLPFPVAAVELQSDGLRLRGGSRATVQGVPVAALRYVWQRQRISLFQVEGGKLPLALRQVVFRTDCYFVRKRGDLTYVAWSFGQTNCVMVARTVPMHLLFRLACHVSEKLERA